MKRLSIPIRALWLASATVVLSAAPAFISPAAADFPACTQEQISQMQDCRSECDGVYNDEEYRCFLGYGYNTGYGYCVNNAQIRQGDCYGWCQQPCD